jgi:L-threonylcarbamoyladenylate synthase
MTLILKRSELAKDFITGHQKNVGVRVPDNPVALSLLSEFEKLGGLGIAAPSANKFGAVSPTNAQAVRDEIGASMTRSDLIIDGGQCRIGIESTIIDCDKPFPIILRSGFIISENIEKYLNAKINISNKSDIKYSGNLKTHYSPKAKIFINKTPKKREGLIALSKISTPKDVIRLCSPTNNEEFANQLYLAFRKADNLGLEVISVFLPDPIGIGESIIDRVKKAAFKEGSSIPKY